jgi:hypothetical protein
MNRRAFFRFLLGGALALGAMWGWKSGCTPKIPPPRDIGDWERRLTFICCDNHGGHSSAIYLRIGGGRAAFDDLRAAAPFMRWNDVGSSAAGLCGFLLRRNGLEDIATAGMISIDPPPEPGRDGTIDWKKYAANQDVIIINVDTGSAKCVAGQMEGEEVHDLPFGGQKIL